MRFFIAKAVKISQKVWLNVLTTGRRRNDSINQMCIGAISVELAKRLKIEPVKALQMFYESKTCEDLHDKSTGLYLYGDLYVADEFMREKELL